MSAVQFIGTREMEPCIDCGEETGGLVIWPDRTYFRQCAHCRKADAAIEAAAGEPEASTWATRTRQASAGGDRPCAAAPADAVVVREYPALKRSCQGQAPTGSPAASLDKPTGPGPVIPAGPAAPAGLRPHPPDDGDHRTRLRARIAAALNGGADQHERPSMSDSSRGTQPPLEKSDICPSTMVVATRQPDGRLLFKRVPCRMKACEVCGPRMRARWAAQWAHAMAGDVVYRQVVAEGEPAKIRRRKAYQGQELGHLPAPDGKRVVYSTAPVGELVTDKIGTLASDFTAMPNDRRNKSLVGTWGQVVADAEAEAAAKRPPPGECLGRVRRSLEHVEIVARELGLFLGRAGTDGILVADPGDAVLWSRFASLIGLVGGRRRRREAA